MIKTTIYSINFNTGSVQLLNNLFRDLRTSSIRELDLIIVRRESIEIIDQVRVLGNIDSNSIGLVLPMGTKHNHGLGLDRRSNVPSDLGQLLVRRMVGVFDEIGAADTEEKSRRAFDKQRLRHRAFQMCRLRSNDDLGSLGEENVMDEG